MFHIQAFDDFMTLEYLKTLNLIISRTKRAFEVKQKTFYLVSQVLFFKLTKQTSKNECVAEKTFKDCQSDTCCFTKIFSQLIKFSHSSVSILLVNIHINWLNRFHYLVLMRGPLIFLIGFMVFLSLFLGTAKVSMSTVIFLAQPQCWISLLNSLLSRLKI